MNIKDFSIQDKIKERVNLEEWYHWGQEPNPELPEARPVRVEFDRKVGFWNFMRRLKP